MLLYVLVYARGSEIFFQLGATQAAILLLVLGRPDLIDIECFIFFLFYIHTLLSCCFNAESCMGLNSFLTAERGLLWSGLSKKIVLAANFAIRCTKAYQDVAKKLFF